MSGLKLVIIGAGSSYTPEIIEGLVKNKEVLPVDQVVLVDIDEKRLSIMAGFCGRFLEHQGHTLRLETTTDRRQALLGAKFVVTQIRVGGNIQRVKDEHIPLKYGILGQETTGPGGMFKGLRTIPVMLEIARDVEKYCPDAWLINYSNPTGLISDAVTKYTQARIAGLCSGGLFPAWSASKALGVAANAVHYDYFGLNHLNFAYNLTVNGRPLTKEEFGRVAEVHMGGVVDPVLVKSMRLLPSPYLQYYFHRKKVVADELAKPTTRGEDVLRIEKEVFEAYADPKQVTKPAALAQRGGGGYSEVALAVMKAIHTNQDQEVIVNVPNRGAISNLPEDAAVEINCLVNAAGITPLRLSEIPAPVWGLVAAVKNYEQLTVEAAVTGNRETTLMALLAHPLVGDYQTAKDLFEEMLEANREYLPLFKG